MFTYKYPLYPSTHYSFYSNNLLSHLCITISFLSFFYSIKFSSTEVQIFSPFLRFRTYTKNSLLTNYFFSLYNLPTSIHEHLPCTQYSSITSPPIDFNYQNKDLNICSSQFWVLSIYVNVPLTCPY